MSARRVLGPVLAAALAGGGAAPAFAASGGLDAGTMLRWSTAVNAAPGGYDLRAVRQAFGERETDRCLQCHGAGALLARDSTSGALRDLGVSGPAHRASAHGALACTQCHADVRAFPHEFPGGRRRVSCADDCHATHAKGRPVRHDEAFAEMRASVHREGLDGRDPRNPDCVTCHGGGDAHRVERVGKGLGWRARLDRCAPCHDDVDAMRAARVEPDAAKSYREGFHYASLRHGGAGAVCEDCHGAHAVRAARDTSASTSAAHVGATCGRSGCHPGATPAFARTGADHLTLRLAEHPMLAGAGRAFRFAGLAVLTVLALLALIDAQWRLRRAPAPREPGDGALVPRLALSLRLQHGALVASFVALAATGLPIAFPDAALSIAWVRVLGGAEGVRLVHRVAALVLVAAVGAHLAGAVRRLARAHYDTARAWPMLPGASDLREAAGTVAHQLGRRAEAPKLGRHTWREKLHYAAVAIGVGVMSVTGLVLAFPGALGAWLPEGSVALVRAAHADEALVAIGVTLVWHLYLVHFAPWPHQRWRTVLDGLVTRALWRSEHPREAEQAERGGVSPGALRPVSLRSRQR